MDAYRTLALLQVMNWRGVFIVFGLLGVAWAAAWDAWFRNEPGEHPAVNAAERELIEAGRTAAADHPTGWAYWRRLFGHRNTRTGANGKLQRSLAA